MRQYGSKSDAYRAAGINAATWDRIEAGETVRPDRLAAAVRLLWPESEGDWRRANAGDRARDAADQLQELSNQVASMQQKITENASRLAELEAAFDASDEQWAARRRGTQPREEDPEPL